MLASSDADITTFAVDPMLSPRHHEVYTRIVVYVYAQII